MTTESSSNITNGKREKVKIARRTISVLEYFASQSQTATVVDLVNHLKVPQSSMSELLSALVSSGILTRDMHSKEFRVTPRLAALGLASQPRQIANGNLFRLVDQLASDMQAPVGLFGMRELGAQLYWIAHASRTDPNVEQPESAPHPDLPTGLKLSDRARLSSGVIGHVLLSAMEGDSFKPTLWRLLAEAPPGAKFNFGELCDKISDIKPLGWAYGEAGFGDCTATAVRVPDELSFQPLVIAAFPSGALADKGLQEAATILAALGRALSETRANVTKAA